MTLEYLSTNFELSKINYSKLVTSYKFKGHEKGGLLKKWHEMII